MAIQEAFVQVNLWVSYLVYFPMILNFKYWYQTRIKDFLYVSLFFLFIALANLATNWDVRDNIRSHQINGILQLVGLYFIVLVATRAKWDQPPKWAEIFCYSTIGSVLVYGLIPEDQYWGVFWIGQWIFNPHECIIYIYLIYCFATTPVEFQTKSRAVWSKTIWVAYSVGGFYQNFIFYLGGPVLNQRYGRAGPEIINVLVVNAFVIYLLLLVLHIFLPEAVMMTREQLVRAIGLYDKFNKIDIPVLDVGFGTITSYLEEAKKKLSDISSGE